MLFAAPPRSEKGEGTGPAAFVAAAGGGSGTLLGVDGDDKDFVQPPSFPTGQQLGDLTPPSRIKR